MSSRSRSSLKLDTGSYTLGSSMSASSPSSPVGSGASLHSNRYQFKPRKSLTVTDRRLENLALTSEHHRLIAKPPKTQESGLGKHMGTTISLCASCGVQRGDQVGEGVNLAGFSLPTTTCVSSVFSKGNLSTPCRVSPYFSFKSRPQLTTNIEGCPLLSITN